MSKLILCRNVIVLPISRQENYTKIRQSFIKLETVFVEQHSERFQIIETRHNVNVISARPRSAGYTIGIFFETVKNTKAFECFFTGFQHSVWKFSTTGNLYSLKSWLWLAAIACVVRWPISNVLLKDCIIEKTCTVVKLAGRLALMVKASAKTTSCKPLFRWYEFHSSQDQFVCLDMFVNGLAVTCWSGWSRGGKHVLAFLHLNSPRHCCI